MDSFNEEQQKFIEKLDENDRIFEEIISKDPNGMVIPFGEERNELERLRKRNQKVLTKLRTREFTVAVVGLEKAGKSTLGNALLKRNILPEYFERCTYTTTKICTGDQDHGRIYFYSAEEFKKNFADTLKIVLQYPQHADFDTMDLNTFSRWWETMADKNPSLYKDQDNKTAADVKVMLEGRNIIRGLLGNSPKDFYGDELETNTFKIFITGIKGFKIVNKRKVAERSAEPYAVKEIIIESSNLNEMKDIVLYDVPGFNSPTELHEKQTLAMLKEADAIILVTNAGVTPNLDKSQLTILRNGRDEENIPLSDKAFVFGNQIDRANTSDEANNTIEILKSDSSKYGVAKQQHVFVGSARAYLESHGIALNTLIKSNNETKDSNVVEKSSAQTMAEYGMPHGIDELWTSMKEYYNNDRFEVLRRRAENTIADAKNFLDGILKKYESAQWQPIETGGEYYLKTLRNLDKFKEEAYVIAESHKERIHSAKPFSNLIREHIENFFPTQDKDSELLAKIKRRGNITTGGSLPLTKIDSLFREELQREFLRNLIEKTAEATEKEEQGIYREVNAKFLEVMGMPADSPYKEELTASVENLFNSLLIKNADKCRFNSLVERFTVGLLEVLISRPFGSSERFQHITEENSEGNSFPQFLSLATYYENSPDAIHSDGEDRYMEFFAKIFLHDNVSASAEIKSSLENFFKANRDAICAGLSFAVEVLPLGKWAKMLLRAGIKANEIPSELKNKIQGTFYKGDWQSLTKDERINRLSDTIDTYAKSKSDFSGKVTVEKLRKMHELSRHMEISNEDEMLKVLNEDIEILRQFTLEAIIYAIGLEQAFVSVMTKNINIIRMDEETPEGAELFDKWITDNIRKVKEDEFRGLDQRNLENQTKKNIVETIRKVADKLGSD